MSKTVSLRLQPRQIEEIKVAAFAAHLPVSTYLYRRVTDTPVLSTPALAALAELLRLTRRLESDARTEPQLVDELRGLVELLSSAASHPDNLG
ncbi:hypothetical protein GRI69_07590 [Erythrobacter vulgaris]|uniref:Uncharacterized protein n=1 Tax=Qipengyuania vulgaris TaxID=291985 RepID=A0A844XRB9_9SPHN|nr:hypothetical protein [Qipengyuania vulgaris]MXO48116.1 hypothetical protein [Qipengyuania vulgaris]